MCRMFHKGQSLSSIHYWALRLASRNLILRFTTMTLAQCEMRLHFVDPRAKKKVHAIGLSIIIVLELSTVPWRSGMKSPGMLSLVSDPSNLLWNLSRLLTPRSTRTNEDLLITPWLERRNSEKPTILKSKFLHTLNNWRSSPWAKKKTRSFVILSFNNLVDELPSGTSSGTGSPRSTISGSISSSGMVSSQSTSSEQLLSGELWNGERWVDQLWKRWALS